MRGTVPAVVTAEPTQKLVSLPLKKEETNVENRENEDKKEEPRKDAAEKKNPDNLKKNKNESTTADGKDKETKGRQIKSVIDINSEQSRKYAK